MSAIDLETLRSLLSDTEPVNRATVHNQIDNLLSESAASASWTDSVQAIVAVVGTVLMLLGAGLTGYLNLREPLNAAVKDIARIESSYKVQCEKLSVVDNQSEHNKDLLEHADIRNQFHRERMNARLDKIEKFIGDKHGSTLLTNGN